MSRATFTNVFIVAGESVVASSAHASEMPRPVEVATATAGTVDAAPWRKTRRVYLLRRSTSLIASSLECLLILIALFCWSMTSAQTRSAFVAKETGSHFALTRLYG